MRPSWCECVSSLDGEGEHRGSDRSKMCRCHHERGSGRNRFHCPDPQRGGLSRCPQGIAPNRCRPRRAAECWPLRPNRPQRQKS